MVAVDASLVLNLFLNEPDSTQVRLQWQLAHQLNRPTIYDCCYVALGDILVCDFWTADRRLANAIGNSLPWVRSL